MSVSPPADVSNAMECDSFSDMDYPTLTDRKVARVAEMRAAVAILADDLAHYAADHGGRFVLFGSAARDDLRFDSDVDVLVDFPVAAEQAAWLFAEARAFELGLEPDLHLAGFAGPSLLARVATEGRPLP